MTTLYMMFVRTVVEMLRNGVSVVYVAVMVAMDLMPYIVVVEP